MLSRVELILELEQVIEKGRILSLIPSTPFDKY